MITIIDVSSLLKKCLTPSTLESLTATTVAKHITSPFAIHCDKFVSEKEKDSISEYQKLLFKRGREHEVQTIQKKYPEIVPIPFTTPEEGFKLALESMFSGSNVLHGMPVFYLPESLLGFVDVLEKSNSNSSIFGKHHYVIKEIKLAKNIRDHHIIQGAFYNYILGKIQGITPLMFYIINRDGDEISYQYTEYEGMLHEAIEGTRKILEGENISPTYASCEFPWESYCNRKAEETNDVSLVADVGQKRKNKLIVHGYKTVGNLADANIQELVKIKGIGEKTAPKFVYAAKAIQAKKPIIKDRKSIAFPNKKVEIFLDLEGTDPSMTDEEIIQVDYLIGILVRAGSKEEYIPFIANNFAQEKKMLFEFLDFMKKQKDYVIYHYYHYEKTHLDKMMTKYKVNEKTRGIVFDHMIDIYKVATDAVAFPTYGNGLKQVASFLGFTWRHKEVDATESIVLYLDYIDDPKKNEDKLKLILDYNEDDCAATRIIKDWLVSVR